MCRRHRQVRDTEGADLLHHVEQVVLLFDTRRIHGPRSGEQGNRLMLYRLDNPPCHFPANFAFIAAVAAANATFEEG